MVMVILFCIYLKDLNYRNHLLITACNFEQVVKVDDEMYNKRIKKL